MQCAAAVDPLPYDVIEGVVTPAEGAGSCARIVNRRVLPVIEHVAVKELVLWRSLRPVAADDDAKEVFGCGFADGGAGRVERGAEMARHRACETMEMGAGCVVTLETYNFSQRAYTIERGTGGAGVVNGLIVAARQYETV